MKNIRGLQSTLFAIAFVFVALADHVRAATIPIATNQTLIEFSGGAMVAGTNYLAGYVSGTNVTSQLISASGQLIGSPLIVGANPGFPPAVAAAGGKTNGLVAWSDQSLGSGVTMFGQIMSANGSLAGAKFPLLSAVGGHGPQLVQAAASDGTNFLVVWQDAGNTSFYGQRVTGSGSLAGSEFFLFSPENGVGDRNIALTFGQTNYLLAWQDGGETNNQTYGMLISPSGVAGGAIQISSTTSLDHNPVAVGFDGTNYLVVWSGNTDYTGNQANWKLYARLVSPSGLLPASERLVVTELASFPALGFDGENYLLAWGYEAATTNVDQTIHARFLNRSANAIGPIFTPFPTTGVNPPLLPLNGVLFDGQRYLLTATFGSFLLSPSGDVMGFSGGDVYGKFLPRSTTAPIFTNVAIVGGKFQGGMRVVPGQIYTIEISTNLLDWTPVALFSSDGTNTLNLVDNEGIAGSSQLFYRAAVGNTLGVSFGMFFLEFANAGSFGGVFTPNVTYPVSLNSYSAALDVSGDLNFPDATNVFFTGPGGSGLVNAAANPDNSSIQSDEAFYQSMNVVSPAAAPGGMWTVNYHGTNITFNLADPQAASRLVIPLPTVTVSGGVLQSVSWVYHDASNGNTLGSAPVYLTSIQVQIDGNMVGRIYDSPHLDSSATSHVLTSSVNWSDVSGLNMAYDDSLGNHYVVSYSKP